MGSGTTAVVALQEGRQYVGIELNSKYVELAEQRIQEWVNSQPKEMPIEKYIQREEGVISH